jgi:hypothetical protein
LGTLGTERVFRLVVPGLTLIVDGLVFVAAIQALRRSGQRASTA